MYLTVANAPLIEAAQRIAPLVRLPQRGRAATASAGPGGRCTRRGCSGCTFRRRWMASKSTRSRREIKAGDAGKQPPVAFNRASQDPEPILMFRIVARVGRGGLFGTPLSARLSVRLGFGEGRLTTDSVEKLGSASSKFKYQHQYEYDPRAIRSYMINRMLRLG